MTVDEFFNRIERLIIKSNEGVTTGQNKIGITTDQRLDILNANTVDEAAKFLLAYGIPQYLIDTAISGTDFDAVTSDEIELLAAREQTGLFGNQDEIIGVPANYIPPRESATDFYTQNDLVNMFAGMEEEQIAAIQADMINAKLLSVGD